MMQVMSFLYHFHGNYFHTLRHVVDLYLILCHSTLLKLTVISFSNIGVSFLMMIVKLKHVGANEELNTQTVELCICWYYKDL